MSCCPFCTVSFRVPEVGVMSKTAGASSETDSAASGVELLGEFVCARTRDATKLDSPMSAVRRVRLVVISRFPQRRDKHPIQKVPPLFPRPPGGLGAASISSNRVTCGHHQQAGPPRSTTLR